MTHTDLIKELRALTSAGMSDCKAALEEANWDLQAAVDIVKIKGLNIADARASRATSEGMVVVCRDSSGTLAGLVETCCQTDFVAQSPEFQRLARRAAATLVADIMENKTFRPEVKELEDLRKDLVATTKENVVIRRWWAEQALREDVVIFDYVHPGSKIAVLLTLQAPSIEIANGNKDFWDLGDELTMQIAAMNPLAVSADRLSPEDVERQRVIFQTQLQEANKPPATWVKILAGKFRKWESEVCLLEQESVMVPKSTVAQVIKSVGDKLGGEIVVVNFVRAQVGEGVDKKQDNLAEEVAKLTEVKS